MTLSKNSEVKLTFLLEPDILASDRYLSTLRRNSCLDPEKQLMLAVLDNGIACFQDNLLARSSKGKSLFREAEDWILDDNTDALYSFRSICEILGLDPDYVRRGLGQWKEAKLRKSRQSYERSPIPRLEGERPSQMFCLGFSPDAASKRTPAPISLEEQGVDGPGDPERKD